MNLIDILPNWSLLDLHPINLIVSGSISLFQEIGAVLLVNQVSAIPKVIVIAVEKRKTGRTAPILKLR
jgi:hypothetical protein